MLNWSGIVIRDSYSLIRVNPRYNICFSVQANCAIDGTKRVHQCPMSDVHQRSFERRIRFSCLFLCIFREGFAASMRKRRQDIRRLVECESQEIGG